MADGAIADLFGYQGDDVLLAGVHRYASGVAAPAIWAGYAAAGVPMCLVAADLPLSAIARAMAYRHSGHELLLDSGAFIYRDRPGQLDWRAVVATYLRLGRGAGAKLTLILPDVVGDQAGSIALAAAYGPRLARLARMGHLTLVPMQRGAMPLPVYFRRYVQALGFDPAGFAIPSNAAAMPVRELEALQLISEAPRRVHFLGISRRAKPLAARVATLRAFWPDAAISADACEHRAHVGEKRQITVKRRQALERRVGDSLESIDDTEHEAWTPAEDDLRNLFPALSEEELEDVVCSSWGVMAFTARLREQLQGEHGPASTTESIEAFARARFAPA